ncbi:MAG: WD40/YVTN/BNR-like repeat-containing protein [Beijerinckiaceae bacterium]
MGEAHISSLMLPGDQGAVFAGAHSGGLYRSADEGRIWASVADELKDRHIFSLDFCNYKSGSVLYAGTEPVSLLRSEDNGLSWQELPAIGKVPGNDKWTFPPPPHLAHTKCFLFEPEDPDTIYAGVEQGALLKSNDSGESWRELDSFYSRDHVWYKDIHRIVRDPIAFDRLYLVTGMGLFVSSDRGETWEHLTGIDDSIGYPDQLIFLEGGKSMLMSGAHRDPSSWRRSHQAHGTVLRSEDGGRSWVHSDNGLPKQGRANIEAFNAARFPGGMLLLCANTDGEVYASSDQATSWRKIADGLPPISKVGHYRNLQEAIA